MTRWVVLGAQGMLGADLVPLLQSKGHSVGAVARADCDITDLAAVRAAVAGADVVVNCAAYTKVDDAETDEAAALAVNGDGARNVAIACADSGAALVHV